MIRTETKRGFTLIELLMVVVIIGVLVGLLLGSLQYIKEHAKDTQATADCKTLQAAVWAYRHEYGVWPGLDDAGVAAIDNKKLTTKNTEYVLRHLHRPNNPRKIQFLDVDNYNWNNEANDYNGTDAVVDPWGTPYAVTIKLTNDTVTVTRQ